MFKKSILIFPDNVNKTFDKFKLKFYRDEFHSEVKNLEIVAESSIINNIKLNKEISLFRFIAESNGFSVTLKLKKPVIQKVTF